jgi:DNA end-binding protein Ku
VKEAELGLAQQVIDSLVGEFDPDELTSEYRQNLRQMLEAKLEGQEIVRPEQPEPEAPVVDLMDALRKSVAEVTESKPKKTRAASKGGSRKRVAARKSA